MCCFWKTNKIGPGLNRQTKWAVLKRIIACFCMILCGFALFFLYFLQLVTEKVVLEPKIWFQPANSVWSTHLLVKIHNMLLLPNCFSWSLVFSLSTVAKSTVVKWFSDQFRSTIRRWIVSQWNFRDLGDWALIVSCSGIIQKPWGVGSHWNWNLLKDSVYIFYCFFLVFYWDHLYPLSEHTLSSFVMGDLPPGVGAQTRPLTFVPWNRDGVPLLIDLKNIHCHIQWYLSIF